jgi:hypothetical protein
MAILIVLFALVIVPLALMLAGLIQLVSHDETKRKKGMMMLLGGVALLGAELLIGYSVCSNINISGGH